jgi:hypothetical protein
MYVVSIDTNTLDTSDQDALIQLSPIKANGTWAAVNDYNAQFHQENLVGILHLVTLTISQGTPGILLCLPEVLGKIGCIICSSQASSAEKY